MIPDSHQAPLLAAAQSVINAVCNQRMGQMQRAPSSEVDFIASIIENGVGLLESAWQSILAPAITVKVAGIFCHQSPMVNAKGTPPRRTSTQRCELADLLILHSHVTQPGKVFNRAVLIQTKMQNAQGTTSADDPQLWLYDEWPPFSMEGRFDGRVRNFHHDRRSGRYGLLTIRSWKILEPALALSAQSPTCLDLAKFLVEMLYDMDPAQPGRMSLHGRQVYRASTYDWSKTIWDILDVTAKKKLQHMGVKAGNYASPLPSRLGGHFSLMCFHYGKTNFSIQPPKKIAALDGPEEGINLFHVVTDASDTRSSPSILAIPEG